MLVIEKAESKNWYLTLTEKVTIANPYFLFNMTHLLTDQVVNVILADIFLHSKKDTISLPLLRERPSHY